MDELDETRTRRDIGYTGSDEHCNWHAVCLETSIECIVVEFPFNSLLFDVINNEPRHVRSTANP